MNLKTSPFFSDGSLERALHRGRIASTKKAVLGKPQEEVVSVHLEKSNRIYLPAIVEDLATKLQPEKDVKLSFLFQSKRLLARDFSKMC